MVKLVLFVLPLGLDTFAVSAALGIAGLPKEQRLKIGFVLSGFEMAMPIVGLLAGHGLGRAIGDAADYLAAAALFALGAWMLLSDEDNEGERVAALAGNTRLGEAARDGAEKVGALALLGLGVLVLVEKVA